LQDAVIVYSVLQAELFPELGANLEQEKGWLGSKKFKSATE